MQNNARPTSTGLKAILSHNETAQPNDDLLNTLKAAVPQFFDKDGNFKSDKFQDELKKSNIAESRDGYKLGFVGKDYARLQVGLKSETMIVPDTKHNAMPENAKSGNVFITGDNIDALRHLVNAYRNQFKLIYIDPPYNTGKEFTYSDNFEFSDEKLKSILGYTDEEIARLKSIQGKSSHSAWLTFMYPRLKIAHRLLRDDGVIFVSIDDNEQANLKLLMDDIFGESNFVGLMTIQSNPRGSQSSKNLSNVHEYVLMYAKNESVMEIKGVSKEEESVTEYLEKEKDGRLFRYLGLRQRGGAWRKEQRPKMHYPIYVNPQNGQVSLMKNEIYKIEVIPQRPTGELGRWTWGKDKLEKNKKLVIGKQKKRTGQQETWDIFRKDYFLDDAGNKKYEKIKTIWIEKETNYQNAKNEMRELFLNSEIFDFPKPTYIIKTLIMMFFSSHDDIILDFFAGSATTAHAVMQLNAEDGGNRKFIIVQLDEETNPDSEARKAGYKTIDEIARARISLAGKKILADYESDLAKQSNGWDKDIGFKHYRLITPDIKTIEKITEFNSEETNLIADDMIKPFEYKDTNTKGLDTILTTWLIDDGYRFDTNAEEIVFGKYAAHYVREAATLYLINRDWDTKALIPLLNQIGKNQLLVKTIVVYPYSFTFEAMRELKTNIKTNLAPSPILIERF